MVIDLTSPTLIMIDLLSPTLIVIDPTGLSPTLMVIDPIGPILSNSKNNHFDFSMIGFTCLVKN